MEMLRIRSFVEAVPAPVRADLSRKVFGLIGIPIDALGLDQTVQLLHEAVENRRPFLLSTPNVNFLVSSLTDTDFRESLLSSDLCTVDGMPIVWIARLLGVPVQERVSGADIFSKLKLGRSAARRSIFLFGGADEAAVQVGNSLNSGSPGLVCVGALNPGFYSVEELSEAKVVDRLNRAKADILGVFLTAKKAQKWLLNNHDRLTAPVRAQFGATINFECGTVRRAPAWLRSSGLEWLWRIKEEPTLWRRYWSDGLVLLQLLLTHALPLAVSARWQRFTHSGPRHMTAALVNTGATDRVCISGFATEENIRNAIECFESALDRGRPFAIDMSGTRAVDPRFFGLLLLVRKELRNRGETLRLLRVPKAIQRTFRLNSFEYLLRQD